MKRETKAVDNEIPQREAFPITFKNFVNGNSPDMRSHPNIINKHTKNPIGISFFKKPIVLFAVVASSEGGLIRKATHTKSGSMQLIIHAITTVFMAVLMRIAIKISSASNMTTFTHLVVPKGQNTIPRSWTLIL
jgi:hypothetical protein